MKFVLYHGLCLPLLSIRLAIVTSILTGDEDLKTMWPTARSPSDLIADYNGQLDALRELSITLKMGDDASSPMWYKWFFETEGIYSVDFCGFPGVSCDEQGYVTSLDLCGMGLSGTLPDAFDGLPKLQKIRLFNNSIHGAIPTSLLKLADLDELNVGRNAMTGTLPNFSRLSSLSMLILDENFFSGTIPRTLCALSKIEALGIARLKSISGSIPPCLGSFNALSVFNIIGSGLTGTIPRELCSIRTMNGFSPNYFGCDGIACAAGRFHNQRGRQVNSEDPCTSCRVPSNVLGSTFCQWKGSTNGNKTQGPSVSTSATSPAPSSTFSVEKSDFPSTAPSITTRPTVFVSPFASPSLQASDSPSITPTAFFTVQQTQPPSFDSSQSTPVPLSRSSHDSITSEAENGTWNFHRGYFSVVAVAGALVVVAAVVRWKRRKDVPPHVAIEDEESECPRIVAKKSNKQNNNENPSDAPSAAGFPKQIEAPKFPESMNQPQHSSWHSIMRTVIPKNASEIASRKVRFIIPGSNSRLSQEGQLRSEDSSSNDESPRNTLESEPATENDPWFSRVMNPLVDACSGTCMLWQGISSTMSQDSATRELSPIPEERTSQSPSSETLTEEPKVLGIRDRSVMSDDSSSFIVLKGTDSTLRNVDEVFRKNKNNSTIKWKNGKAGSTAIPDDMVEI
jgi:hypothetical protein